MSDVAVISFSDISKMGAIIAKSGLFGVKTEDQAIALMLVAQAEGLHPATAARDYHIIDGRPSLKADAMLARFQNAGGKVCWSKYEDTIVVGTFSHPAGGEVTVSWDKSRAEKAGLWGKKNWVSYSRQMLKARVTSEAIRMILPSVLVGTYTPEEIEDMAPEPKNVTPEKTARETVFETHNAYTSDSTSGDEIYRSELITFIGDLKDELTIEQKQDLTALIKAAGLDRVRLDAIKDRAREMAGKKTKTIPEKKSPDPRLSWPRARVVNEFGPIMNSPLMSQEDKDLCKVEMKSLNRDDLPGLLALLDTWTMTMVKREESLENSAPDMAVTIEDSAGASEAFEKDVTVETGVEVKRDKGPAIDEAGQLGIF